MISRQYRCIFVHQRKAAGTSIIRSFGFDPSQPEWHLFNDGVLSSEWEPEGALVRGCFKFSVVRNPWDRFVSGWKYCTSTAQLTLREALRNLPTTGHDYRHLTRPQCDILLESDGTLAVDLVIRFENLQADFDRVCERIGRPRVLLPHLNAMPRREYRWYFDDETRALLADHFHRDIEYFDYRF